MAPVLKCLIDWIPPPPSQLADNIIKIPIVQYINILNSYMVQLYHSKLTSFQKMQNIAPICFKAPSSLPKFLKGEVVCDTLSINTNTDVLMLA